MTEQEYQDLVVRAKEIINTINDFPAHEMMTYAKEHHRKDGFSFALTMWSVKCEASCP